MPEVGLCVCKFGCRIVIGKRDDGEVVGVSNPRGLMEEIPNSILNLMNFHPNIEPMMEDGKTCLILTIKPQDDPVDLRGVYYTRSGSTTVRVTGRDIRPFVMERLGLNGIDVISKRVNIEDISSEAVGEFVKRGQEKGHISLAADPSDVEGVLRKYDLMTDEGIRKAGAIQFGKRPRGVSYAAVTKIGLFAKKGGMILMEDIIDGPVISQPDETLKRLLDKYTQPRFRLKNYIERIEVYRYPPKALREAILNAVIHRQYTSVQETTIRVYPNSVEVYNPGALPKGWTADELPRKNESRPANPVIAQAFHNMGLIEGWGIGMSLIQDECKAAGVPAPEYVVDQDGVRIIFRSGPWSDTGEDIEKSSIIEELTSSEIKICKIIAEGGYTTAKDIAICTGLSIRTVNRIIVKLKNMGIIYRIGNNRKGSWKLVVESSNKD